MAGTTDVSFNASIFAWPQPRFQTSWFGIWVNAMSLTIDASTVIGLRVAVLAKGGKTAGAEAFDMVSEKIAAGISLQNKAFTGRLGTTARMISGSIVDHYLPEVRANRDRLALLV